MVKIVFTSIYRNLIFECHEVFAIYVRNFNTDIYVLIRLPVSCNTVNVDIFACIHFRGFMKMGHFACIKIRVFSIIISLGYYKTNFRGVHIFADI